ncbi:hypothetical protein C0W57_17620 [Bacillus velezensis]|nr:hypothetical protein BMJ37_18960 [Bacillus velezensis]AUS17892.1 hypothetical protein C0W57_17620 [Bacillus velezensis]AWM46106.1 hypothetical protein BAALB65_19580 [Bacillus amyloliquefaciens]KAF1277070.1 hypothetical protein BUE72_07255 [Bacillus amyloliquefaciens]PQB10923.1 hypothetical protein C5O26_11855 [Bacillus velezensis]
MLSLNIADLSLEKLAALKMRFKARQKIILVQTVRCQFQYVLKVAHRMWAILDEIGMLDHKSEVLGRYDKRRYVREGDRRSD